jgi:hypothetical protein
MKNLHLWQQIIKEEGGKVLFNDHNSIYFKLGEGESIVDGFFVVINQNGYLQMQYRTSESQSDIKAAEDIIIDGHYISEINDKRYDEIERVLLEFIDKC